MFKVDWKICSKKGGLYAQERMPMTTAGRRKCRCARVKIGMQQEMTAMRSKMPERLVVRKRYQSR